MSETSLEAKLEESHLSSPNDDTEAKRKEAEIFKEKGNESFKSLFNQIFLKLFF